MKSCVLLMPMGPNALPSSEFAPDITGTWTNLPLASCMLVYPCMKSPSTIGCQPIEDPVPLIHALSVSKGSSLKHCSLSEAEPHPSVLVAFVKAVLSQ